MWEQGLLLHSSSGEKTLLLKGRKGVRASPLPEGGMSSWLCPMETEPTGLQAHLTPNLRALQSSRPKLSLGPAAHRGLNLSFNCSHGQGAPSLVIHFFLYLDFTAPSRHSGQADTSPRAPRARCNNPPGEVCSHFTLTTWSQFLAHRLVAPKILTRRPSRVESPFSPVLLQEQVPGMIQHWNKLTALCTHPTKQRSASAGILALRYPQKARRSRHRQTHLNITLAKLPYT